MNLWYSDSFVSFQLSSGKTSFVIRDESCTVSYTSRKFVLFTFASLGQASEKFNFSSVVKKGTILHIEWWLLKGKVRNRSGQPEIWSELDLTWNLILPENQ